tara:strand:+ start:113 stop:334 length:222 start_codon:yes stop_codon:yes gene_type:complete
MPKNITILEQSAKALYSALSREDIESYSFSSIIPDMSGYDAPDDRPMKFNSMLKIYDTNRKSITGGQRPGHGG